MGKVLRVASTSMRPGPVRVFDPLSSPTPKSVGKKTTPSGKSPHSGGKSTPSGRSLHSGGKSATTATRGKPAPSATRRQPRGCGAGASAGAGYGARKRERGPRKSSRRLSDSNGAPQSKERVATPEPRGKWYEIAGLSPVKIDWGEETADSVLDQILSC